LTVGQQTGDIDLIRKEQAAYRGLKGPAAEDRAKQFFDQQQPAQIQSLSDRISQSFDPAGQQVADNPQSAAAIAQKGIQGAAATEKAAVNAKYQTARGLPGEIDAGAIRGTGQAVKADLSSRAEPVVIDDKLTPWASRAIDELDNASEFKSPNNKASPYGQPNPNQVSGVTLEGVDQVRKRLVQMRQGAYGSGNASDGRATSAVMNAFDDHIDQAINSGAFRGDPAAVQAWNDARAASSAFKQKFSGKDPVSKQVQKILGRPGTDPITPNDVADAIYGGSGTNPNSTNVGLARRVKAIVGDTSPEWSAIKQGLWSRLTERGTGQSEMGPTIIKNRIAKFLNSDGKEMADAVYSPQERRIIGQFGELQGKLEVPKTGANTSETSTFLAPILNRIGKGVEFMIGALVARHFGAEGMGEIIGGALTEKTAGFIRDTRNANQIAKQMPLVNESVAKFQKAVQAFNRASSPPTRVGLSIATTNMARTLKSIGVSLDGLLPSGTIPAAADQNQNQ